MKDNTRRNTWLLSISWIIVILLYFILGKTFFTIKERVCDESINSGTCFQLAPTALGFWIMTIILFMVLVELIFLTVRLNKWHEKTTTINESKGHAIWLAIPTIGFLILLSGPIIHYPILDVLKVVGIILLVLGSVIILFTGLYYLGNGVEWLFKKWVKLNEWILKRLK